MKSLSMFVLASVLVVGCGGKKDDGKAASSGAKTEEGAAKPAGPNKLDKLGGLTIEFAGTVDKQIAGDGIMIQNESGLLTVEEMKPVKSIDDAKSDAAMYSPKDLKADVLPDGYVVTYNNSGGMGANYFVVVRRDLGGKSYLCSTTASSADQSAAVVAACKTLKK